MLVDELAHESLFVFVRTPFLTFESILKQSTMCTIVVHTLHLYRMYFKFQLCARHNE